MSETRHRDAIVHSSAEHAPPNTPAFAEAASQLCWTWSSLAALSCNSSRGAIVAAEIHELRLSIMVMLHFAPCALDPEESWRDTVSPCHGRHFGYSRLCHRPDVLRRCPSAVLVLWEASRSRCRCNLRTNLLLYLYSTANPTGSLQVFADINRSIGALALMPTVLPSFIIRRPASHPTLTYAEQIIILRLS
ncbi:hypothetical protein K469DRAFT_25307 [Zopfia rhizophila CBS 207.26]|uniref:Uncharacterized protein n=1 Tax=Zopfia rhizophila CBS 207.26 TaxID=1314779 RepID=A0A6A6EH74_9PEZI|nr:hypothetical protein K469DRAFT_25307 [Zopfia rhizophila CBS 207.26]